jgi:hypothetical protein
LDVQFDNILGKVTGILRCKVKEWRFRLEKLKTRRNRFLIRYTKLDVVQHVDMMERNAMMAQRSKGEAEIKNGETKVKGDGDLEDNLRLGGWGEVD